MKHIENLYIDEFRGYLKCLSRLCANGYVFSVTAYSAVDNVDYFASKLVKFWNLGDEYIEPSCYEFLNSNKIEYDTLLKQIEKYIFNGLLERSNMPSKSAETYATKMLTDDINEYYGLVSVSLNDNGIFHPLISNDVYVLNIHNPRHEKSLYFIVKIEEIYVLTHLIKQHVNQP